MVGLPQNLQTRADWINAYQYAVIQNGEQKAVMKNRLQALKETGTMLVLKPGVDKPAEEQTPEDFEPVDDPASPLARSGLSAAEINSMILILSQ
jgi:hypothetical protein